MKHNKIFVFGLLVIILALGFGCSRQDTPGQQTPEQVDFGDYPADYVIAYATMVGFSKAPTVRSLFGPDAYFVTSFQDVPAEVTVESTNATEEEFTAQLLLATKVPEEEVKITRMQITFESDSMSEMSCLRYIKLVNMRSGETTEEISYGDEMSDAGLMAFFAGMLSGGLFWDVSKYNQ